MSEQGLEKYRAEARSWFAEHLPSDWRERLLTASRTEWVEWDRWWLRELHSGGYAAPHWPVEFGGGGASVEQDLALQQEFVRADAPWPMTFFCALNHASHALIQFGSDEQKQHLARILAGEQVWCQAFSEPNAGSDLAALQTTAQRQGDHYVLNGQKTWSSTAEHADRAILLARTDKNAPKHKGITYFLLDLHAPGVERRAIKQMTGNAEFCEIFLNDVAVPVSDRLGEENQGWSVARSSLATERGKGFIRHTMVLRGIMRDLLALAARRGVVEACGEDVGHLRQELAGQYCEVEILDRLCDRMLSTLVRTGGVGPEASIVKLFYSELHQRVTDTAVQIDGLPGQIAQAQEQRGGVGRYSHWLLEHLGSYPRLIGAGTNEIQRSLIGERTLGLPREPAMK